ncbi:MAG TPA: isocitrate dehydrogenase kinase/phosphatase AceK regulatory subunit [Steroidobacteraceae bacterium]|jgi:isocitrate dehydrogenase kinase/phosphatase|nr:isocitrate dehydrogenase kinase/phosphatase AceK regulatory subunit [Steroidobacteraceae bacterium]
MAARAISEVERGYGLLAAASSDADRVMATAALILSIFAEFYAKFCEYSHRAKRAFEHRDPRDALNVSKGRLGLYTRYIAEHGPRIRALFEELSVESVLWDSLDRLFAAMIVDRYDADIAFSFAHSVRRNINHGLWKPVAYSFPPPSRLRAMSMASVHRRLAVHGSIDDELLCAALQVPGFSVAFKDLPGDAQKIRRRVEQLLAGKPENAAPVALDVVEAGFFRDRRAFVVGRWVFADDHVVPLVVALQNGTDGIYADAVLHRTADIHNLFSSTLANMHVTTALYYQTCVFLFSLMPRRPLGEHYSTIGYNHVGKVAILNEITSQLRDGVKFQRSPGAPGTVAVGFTFDACSYHLKVIRDRPTHSYKWGAFPGVRTVIEKYRAVHEINRAGSMLDNVMYFNMRLDRDMFDPMLLDEISREASGSVQIVEDGVFLRSLIVQLKIVPLPVYLRHAGEAETQAVMAALGQCIRNNAATNIFNKDLDSRNYGVGRYGRVFLFDYDAVEKLTDVKIRTNQDREPGEEGVPEWFFEDGVIFLPEELEHGMQIESDYARRCFRQENADLLTVQYWLDLQQKLLRGEVPALRMYPDATKLDADVS